MGYEAFKARPLILAKFGLQMIGTHSFYLFFAFFLVQDTPPLKPTTQFDIITNYQLKKKPTSDNVKIVFERQEIDKETGTDLLPYLAIQLRVKHWNPEVNQVRVVDELNKTYLKKKINDTGIYDLELGFIDDIKDGVTSGNFVVNFLNRKKVVEIITITIKQDGTFLVNDEKRGKF